MLLDQALNAAATFDLTVPFQITSMLCGLLSIYVMQQTWNDRMSKDDPPLLQTARRLAFIVFALGIFWRVSYLDKMGERPSAPEFLAIIGLTLLFFVRSALLHRHRIDSRTMPPPLPGQRRPF